MRAHEKMQQKIEAKVAERKNFLANLPQELKDEVNAKLKIAITTLAGGYYVLRYRSGESEISSVINAAEDFKRYEELRSELLDITYNDVPVVANQITPWFSDGANMARIEYNIGNMDEYEINWALDGDYKYACEHMKKRQMEERKTDINGRQEE